MKVLGISAFHQDAAAALLVDGRPVAAGHEGLYSKTPLDASLPLRAARSCLERAGLTGPELDRVVFYEKPLRRFERTLVSGLRSFPRGGRGFAREVSRWLGDRLWLKGQLCDEFGVTADRIEFVEHALSHAASAYYPSPFDEAAALVLDDVGEWSTCAIAHGRGTRLELLVETHLPHSLGLAASAFVQFLGFDPGQDDLLLVDLAAHGAPRFRQQVAALIGLDPDGAPRLDLRAFHFGEGARRLYTDALVELFGPARVPGGPLRLGADDPRDADLAASVQALLEERALGLAALARERTGSPNLVVAGALARNRGVVSALVTHAPFEAVHVPPEPSDAGGALGAALFSHHAAAGAVRAGAGAPLALGESLGSACEREPARRDAGWRDLLEDLLAGRPVGWARGALEFTPDSLGARIVLGDPRPGRGRVTLLGALQRSEPYLGCRLALPAGVLARYVDAPGGTAAALALAQLGLPATDELRAAAPGAVQADGRCWVQAVSPDGDPDLHALLEAFGQRSGVPALLIDTLRLRGAVTPRFDHEALDVLDRSQLAALLCEDRLFRGARTEAAA